MHFQVISDDFYNKIFDKIIKYFPSFNSVYDKEDGIYPILGELSTFISENFYQEDIRKQTAEAIEQGGSETENAIVLQLFHRFYEDVGLTNEIRKLLGSKSLIVFDKYRNDF